MKPYSILIHATGPCGEGTEQSADIALGKLLKQLESAGHKFESVSMIIDGSAVPIIGPLKEHPAPDAAAPDPAVTVDYVLQQLGKLATADQMSALFSELQGQRGRILDAIAELAKNEAAADDAPKPRKPRAKKEEAPAGGTGSTTGDPLEKVTFSDAAGTGTTETPKSGEQAPADADAKKEEAPAGGTGSTTGDPLEKVTFSDAAGTGTTETPKSGEQAPADADAKKEEGAAEDKAPSEKEAQG